MPGSSWLAGVARVVGLLLVVALAARVIWELLVPLLPALGVLLVLVAVVGWLVGRRSW
jgi:hypothetical protein